MLRVGTNGHLFMIDGWKRKRNNYVWERKERGPHLFGREDEYDEIGIVDGQLIGVQPCAVGKSAATPPCQARAKG